MIKEKGQEDTKWSIEHYIEKGQEDTKWSIEHYIEKGQEDKTMVDRTLHRKQKTEQCDVH